VTAVTPETLRELLVGLRLEGEATVVELRVREQQIRLVEVTPTGWREHSVPRGTPLAAALAGLAARTARPLLEVVPAPQAALLLAATRTGLIRRSAPVRVAAVSRGWHVHLGQAEA